MIYLLMPLQSLMHAHGFGVQISQIFFLKHFVPATPNCYAYRGHFRGVPSNVDIYGPRHGLYIYVDNEKNLYNLYLNNYDYNLCGCGSVHWEHTYQNDIYSHTYFTLKKVT